jgi:NodT family efflux transporter outer membrane factor (OMF) lipoprotein
VRIGAWLIAALVAGCQVGPDYRGPPEVGKTAIASPQFLRTGGEHIVPAPPPARWWDAVRDPLLTQLIEDALAANPTLKSAQARVRSARARLQAARAGYLPSGGATASYLRARIPTGTVATAEGGGSLPNPLALDLYSADVDASWELDVFGGTRRGVESARALQESSLAAFHDAQVQLASQVAQAYVSLRAAQASVFLDESTIDLESRSMALTRQRLEAGTTARGDLERQQTQVQQARAQLPTQQAEVVQLLDQLAELTGREPGALDELLRPVHPEAVAVPLPPATIPVGTPADWLRRRPDIREAERTLAARTATIGENVAAYFPTVTLLGAFGNNASAPSGLAHGTPLSLLSPGISWSFLSIPKTRARVRGAEADRDQALADYEGKVLAALRDANGALFRFGRDVEALKEWQGARDAAANAARVMRERYAAGTATLIDSLDTERQRVQAENQLVQAQSQLMVDYVTLQKSLGLGWGDDGPNPP